MVSTFLLERGFFFTLLRAPWFFYLLVEEPCSKFWVASCRWRGRMPNVKLWELCPFISAPFLDLTNVSIYCSYLELKYMPLIERIRRVSGQLECNSSMSVFLSLLPLLSVLSLKCWMSTITACLQIALPGVMILDWYFCCDRLINSFSRSFPIYVISAYASALLSITIVFFFCREYILGYEQSFAVIPRWFENCNIIIYFFFNESSWWLGQLEMDILFHLLIWVQEESC